MQKIKITVLNRKSKFGQSCLTRIYALRENGEIDKIREIN